MSAVVDLQDAEPTGAPESQPTALYRHFDADGALLYVGITNNPQRRLAEHKCRAIWADQIDRVTVKWLPSREDGAEAERIAIATEGPIFNGRGDGGLNPTGDPFKDWMARTGITQTEIARQFGVARSTTSQIILGERKASLRFAVFIEDWSEGEVPVRYWLYGATVQPHKRSLGAAE